MEDVYKEVYFNEFCKTCKYSDLKEEYDPCDDCLAAPMNTYSHKPIRYKEKEK